MGLWVRVKGGEGDISTWEDMGSLPAGEENCLGKALTVDGIMVP